MRNGTRLQNERGVWRTVAGLSGLAIGLGVLGCSGSDVSPLTYDAPRSARAFDQYDPGDRYISEMLAVRPDNRRSGRGPVIVGRHALNGSIDGGERSSADARLMRSNPGELMRVKYAANKVNAQDVLRVLIGEYLSRDYIVDATITEQITMDIDSEMTAGDVHDLLGALCLIHGWVIDDNGTALVVRKTTNMARQSQAPVLRTRALLDSDGVAIRVRRLRYIGPADVRTLLEPVMSSGAVQIPVGQTIVLIDTVRQLNRVSDLLSAIDVPEFDGVEIVTYRLSDRRPQEAATLLDSLVQGAGLRARNAAMAAFIPVENSNLLIVIARDRSVLPRINTLIEQVDSPRNENARYRFAYRIQHYPARELQVLIDKFFENRIAQGPAELVVDSEKMKLVWDLTGELLLVQATLDDYQDLLEVLRAVDRPKQQVVLEAVIAEVALNETLRYGVEYFLEQTFDGLGVLELAGAPGLVANPTGSAFLVGSSGVAIVQALQTQSTVNIVSQPKITVLNGATAKFQVGGSVPVVQADTDTATQVDGSTAIRRNIEYRETGVILEVVPRLNESGLVELHITQEITDVGPTTDLGPTFTTRILDTRAIVPHGKTIVLGGFIESRTSESKSKIPLLGNLPVLGPLFTNLNDVEDRTEIILTLTPRVLSDPAQGAQTVDGFLEAAWAVRAALMQRQDELPEGMLRQASGDELRSDREFVTAVPRIFFSGDDENGAPDSKPAGTPEGESPVPQRPDFPPILRELLESINSEREG